MANQWVTNSSPIITLSKISRINLLTQLCDELVIPQGVADEIQNGGHDDPASAWIRTEGKPYIKPITIIDSTVANWDLGAGESAVMSWICKNPSFEAIIDDRAARKAAAVLGMQVRGTVSIIALAKQKGCITSAREDYDKLLSVGFRISEDVIAKALALVSE